LDFNEHIGKVELQKTAFLFPGQGTQYVGMGRELAENSAAAREVFDEVDEILGTSLSSLIFEGPEIELTRTFNAQPAVMAVSLACLESLKERYGSESLPSPAFVAGHSLGEYTALVPAGVLSLSDAILLVRERGRLMQEASDTSPGSMAVVIGLDELTLEEVCRETGAEVANVNAVDQVVIAGDKVSLARAMDLAAMRGAKRLIRLQVSGAFHTRLMETAAEGMSQVLDNAVFHDPNVPIVGNYTGLPLLGGAEIREELKHQLCGCVRWKNSVDHMANSGVTRFYEIGPGQILSNLVKRAYPWVTASSISGTQAIADLDVR
jgi:[acyl-carrier-protein] S-malonyltransferase